MYGYDNKAKVGYGQVTDHARLPMFFDKEGTQHAVVGYAQAHNYKATTEQVVEFRRSSGIGRMEPYEGFGIRDKPILMPWVPSIHDQPHGGDGFSSKVHNHVGHGQAPWKRDANESNRFPVHDQNNGLPWNRDASDQSLFAIHDQSRGSPRHRDASDPSRFPIHGQSKNSPRHRDASDPSRFAVHDQSRGSPRNKDANNVGRFPIYGQSKDSPRSKDAYESNRFMSPPPKDHYYNTPEDGENDHSSDDEDDVICEDGVCSVNKKGGSKPINHLKQEDYDREKQRGNGYAPKKDSYYETPYNYNEKHRGIGYAPRKDSSYETSYDNNEKPKGTGHVPSSYTVPITTPPGKDTYYEPSPRNNNRPTVDGLKPIKTRTGAEFPKENKRNSPVSIGVQPQYNGSPRRDHGYEDTNYKASPPARTIDSREAAKKYNGVLLTN